MANFCVAYMDVAMRRPDEGREQERKLCKLSNSPAKAGPMSTANALGLTYVSRLELDHFDSQPDLSRINQRLPSSGSVPACRARPNSHQCSLLVRR